MKFFTEILQKPKTVLQDNKHNWNEAHRGWHLPVLWSIPTALSLHAQVTASLAHGCISRATTPANSTLAPKELQAGVAIWVPASCLAHKQERTGESQAGSNQHGAFAFLIPLFPGAGIESSTSWQHSVVSGFFGQRSFQKKPFGRCGTQT